MWKLLLLAAAMCAVRAQGPDMERMRANLTALWEEVDRLKSSGECRTQVRITLDADGGMGRSGGPMGGRGAGGRPGGHGDEEEMEGEMGGRPGRGENDMEMEEGDRHGRHGGHDRRGGHGRHHGGHHGGHHGEGRGDAADVHVHLHVNKDSKDSKPQGDVLHGAPFLPPHLASRHVHGRCEMHGELDGTIEMRQRLDTPRIEMDFDVSGFEDMDQHHHAFRVHWHGVTGSDCASIGHVFAPPHTFSAMQPGREGRPSSEEDLEGEVTEEEAMTAGSRRRRSHHHMEGASGERPAPANERTPEGDLGNVSCNAEGILEGHMEFPGVSLVGLHAITGRSLAVHATDDPHSAVLGCCIVTYVDGEYWGENDEWEDMYPEGEE